MNGTMNNTSTATREQISRWLDGDIAPHEIDLAMATLAREDGRYCWAEMHFVGDCIRGLEDTPGGCAERIRLAISSEPTVVAPVARRLREQAQLKERSMVAALTSIGRGGRAWATAAAIAAVGFVGTVVYKDQIATPQVATLSAAPATANVKATADFSAYLQAHQESADISSLSPMRQYLRPAAILQAQ